jgi:hypothetical protein
LIEQVLLKFQLAGLLELAGYENLFTNLEQALAAVKEDAPAHQHLIDVTADSSGDYQPRRSSNGHQFEAPISLSNSHVNDDDRSVQLSGYTPPSMSTAMHDS